MIDKIQYNKLNSVHQTIAIKIEKICTRLLEQIYNDLHTIQNKT